MGRRAGGPHRKPACPAWERTHSALHRDFPGKVSGPGWAGSEGRAAAWPEFEAPSTPSTPQSAELPRCCPGTCRERGGREGLCLCPGCDHRVGGRGEVPAAGPVSLLPPGPVCSEGPAWVCGEQRPSQSQRRAGLLTRGPACPTCPACGSPGEGEAVRVDDRATHRHAFRMAVGGTRTQNHKTAFSSHKSAHSNPPCSPPSARDGLR